MADPDEIPTYDLRLRHGDRWTRTITIRDGAGAAVNLTGMAWRAQIRRTRQSSQVLASLTATVAVPASGVLTLVLSGAAVAGIPATGQTPWVWDLEETTGEQTLIEGSVWVSEDVSRP